MKNTDFRIRDPFILPYEGKYYMYASNYPYGFMVYTGTDLENWEEPVEIIRFPEGFWATKDFWAPEVHYYQGKFYLFASLYSDSDNRGTQIFRSASPTGPFEPISEDPATPGEWMCLDGTLYVDKGGTPYMVFCHEWLQIKNGTVCYVQLSEDLSQPVGEPKLMFSAGDYPFVKNVTDDPENLVTDGPFLYRCENGDLVMIWSSYGQEGYFESVLKSDNGEIDGRWIAQDMLFEKDGGHGMIFRDFDGKLRMSLHQPNIAPDEHLKLFELKDCGGTLKVIG